MTGTFIVVKCEKCKNEQTLFDRSTSVVHCLVCKEVLAKPTGGRAELVGKKVAQAKTAA